ncbi:MAG: hypothetical protein KGK34_11230 [Chloroflexota bacterium]|nr:hypothetical protein [Chloroflexota bacterium]
MPATASAARSALPLTDTGVTLARNADATLVVLSLDPGAPGANAVRVDLRDELGATVAGSVHLALSLDGRSASAVTLAAGSAVTLQVPRAGHAEISATVTEGKAAGAATTFALDLPVARVPDGMLAGIDAATTSLHTMRETETLTAGGPVLHFHFEYLAPDRVHYTTLLPTGVTDETVLIGRDRFDRDGNGPWTKSDIGFPSKVPYSDYAPRSTRVRLIGHDVANGQELLGISFVVNAAVFYTIWAGAQDHLVRRYTMMTMGHYMAGSYSDFNAPLDISAP